LQVVSATLRHESANLDMDVASPYPE
jgi:hypothetical protein